MSDDVLVRVENVSKRFCRSLKHSLWYGLQDLGSEIIGRRHGGGSGLPQSSADVQLRPDEFWAVKDVSFELRRGESLGLIGRNGAGKTTLLRMLTGLIKPDTGSVSMRGKVGSVIALGAGFNPVLTGRENIYTSCTIFGLSKNEINERLEEIVEFSELEEFIDSPVQSYSSGMQVRLGFAAATAQKPDILILDEVLAVGDAQFRSKCYERIDSLRKDTALIFVSHAMDQIARLCGQGIMLNKGEGKSSSDIEKVVLEYEHANECKEEGFTAIRNPLISLHAKAQPATLRSGSSLKINIEIASRRSLLGCKLRFMIYNISGAMCAESGLVPLEALGMPEIKEGTSSLEVATRIPLKAGSYKLSFNIISPSGEILAWKQKETDISLVSDFYSVTDSLLILQ